MWVYFITNIISFFNNNDIDKKLYMLKRSEVDVAKQVIKWLEEYHWEIYQEVKFKFTGGVADIVAVQNNLIWIIETKTILGLKVIEQADKWRYLANYVSIATPGGPNNNFIDDILKWKKIGRIIVNENDCYEPIGAFLNRKALTDKIKKGLNEKHKTYAEAGNNKGRYWSPFKETCRQILLVVMRENGILLNDLIHKINHHYHTPASAKTSIVEWTKRGYIQGIEVRLENNKYRFYLK